MSILNQTGEVIDEVKALIKIAVSFVGKQYSELSPFEREILHTLINYKQASLKADGTVTSLFPK